ncbi:MAG: coproporphyrinogen dehydrogenase HemZ [Negativicutes bacterium]|nr:coproporphyrinogen dehydrogenase HemZ [Negativicutes bacterium]
MIIDGYRYPQNDELTKAVGEAMALYAIPASPASRGNTVEIANRVIASPYQVVTVLEFSTAADGLQRWEEVSSIAPAGESRRDAARRLTQMNILALLQKLTGRIPTPWGILRGVRPGKLAHRFFDQGLPLTGVVARLQSDYAVTPAKAELIADIAQRQRTLLLSPAEAKKTVSVYIGIPFCPSRCLYCSFPAYLLPADRAALDSFLGALEEDISAAAEVISRYGLSVQTVYIGGGTPTSLPAADFERLLATVREAFFSCATREFTVEAGRPDTLDDAKIAAMRRAGVTRISVNPQTMQEKTLKLIGRRHSVHDIIVVLEKTRSAHIPVVNMDIIVGLPGEDEAQLADTMDQIAGLAPDNLTVHTLAIKKGSRLKDGRAGFELPREGAAARMLAIADGCARKLGMVPYYLYRQKYMADNLENIGYALPGRECLYNIQIIEERQTVIGIGPAAATKAVEPGDWRLTRSYMPKDLSTYINYLAKHLDRRGQLLARLMES